MDVWTVEDLLIDWEVYFDMGRDYSAIELTRDCPHLRPELEKRIKTLKRFRESFDNANR